MIEFAHINIITDDWRKLADFYINVFECKPIYPERDLKGQWLDNATMIENTRITGIHLSLRGCQLNSVTIEIFQYDQNQETLPPATNRKGFAHIAFRVDNVHEVLERLLVNGGTQLGQLIEKKFDNLGRLTFVYAQDIDGNIIEIQNWKK